MDYGCPTSFSKVEIRNGQNGDRGVKDFEVRVSHGNDVWTMAYSGTLMDARGDACGSTPLQTFAFSVPEKLVRGRYVKFVALNSYGSGGYALQYFNMVQADKREGEMKSSCQFSSATYCIMSLFRYHLSILSGYSREERDERDEFCPASLHSRLFGAQLDDA